MKWKVRLAWRVLCNRATAFRMVYLKRDQGVATLRSRSYRQAQPFGKRAWLAWEIIMGRPVGYRISMVYDQARDVIRILDKDQWFYQCFFTTEKVLEA